MDLLGGPLKDSAPSGAPLRWEPVNPHIPDTGDRRFAQTVQPVNDRKPRTLNPYLTASPHYCEDREPYPPRRCATMEASEIKIIAKKCEILKPLNDEELDLLLFYGEEKGFNLPKWAFGVLTSRRRGPQAHPSSPSCMGKD